MALNKKIVEREGRISKTESAVGGRLGGRSAKNEQAAPDKASGVRLRKIIRDLESAEKTLIQLKNLVRSKLEQGDYKKAIALIDEPLGSIQALRKDVSKPNAIYNVDVADEKASRYISEASKVFTEVQNFVEECLRRYNGKSASGTYKKEGKTATGSYQKTPRSARTTKTAGYQGPRLNNRR